MTVEHGSGWNPDFGGYQSKVLRPDDPFEIDDGGFLPRYKPEILWNNNIVRIEFAQSLSPIIGFGSWQPGEP